MHSDHASLLDCVDESVLVFDPHGRMQLCNRAARQLYGLSASAIEGRSIADVLAPAYPVSVAELRAAVDADGRWCAELERRVANGATAFIEVRVVAQRDCDGNIISLVETGRDVTAAKRISHELQYNEFRYHNLFQAMAASFWELDFSAVEDMLRQLRKRGVADFKGHFRSNPDFVREMMRATRVIDVNDQTVALFGLGSKEGLLTTVEPYWPEESTQAYADGILAGVTGQPHYTVECKLRRIDGSLFDALFTSAYPKRTMGKGTLLVGVVDISERKQAYAALEQSERRFRALFQYMPIGLTLVSATKLVPMFRDLRAQGVTDLGAYIDAHPDFLARAVEALEIEEVNDHNVTLFGARDADEMRGPITRYWQAALPTIRRSLEAGFRNEDIFSEETRVVRLDGQELDVLFTTARPGAIADKSLVGFIDITDRKRSEAALQISEYRYRNMFQALTAAFWELDFSGANAMVRAVMKTGVTDLRAYFAKHPAFVRDMMRVTRVVDVNDQTVRLFGNGSRESLRENVEPFWAEESTGFYAEAYLRAVERQPSFSAECKLRRIDGSLFDGLFTVAYPPPSLGRGTTMVGVIDISARKKSEAALIESEARYQNLFQAMAVSFWELDFTAVGELIRAMRASGVTDFRRHFAEHPRVIREIMAATRVVDVNDRTVALFGRGDKSELLGTTEPLWPEESWPHYASAILSAFDHEPRFSVETRLRRLDGTCFDAEFTVWYSAQDRKKGLAGVLDITERNRVQARLREVEADFAHAARVSMLGELTASIAHEVNQPLAAIATNGEAGLRWLGRPEPDVAEARDLIKRIVADARRAASIISRVRSMATRAEPHYDSLALDDVVKDALGFIRHEVQSRNVLITHYPGARHPVRGDRTQLQQVIVNLAINAMQAMEPTAASGARITIRTAIDGDARIVCSVEDSGPGISDESLSRLFESFFTTKTSGMGMGLPICRSIIEGHGGRIHADNKSALGGARFVFDLPIAN
ncbi:MAG: PAS domain S-box protein [Hyphomicrobiaceae bacterium]|nr:PAS domain S-box protein [Hyphomicrobiaceae bacterium]